ncbi:MAG: carbohydrate-binding protein [Burkholderiales bacterium]|nr:carbohydrate-binding protein [Opitutaceae bacterium]
MNTSALRLALVALLGLTTLQAQTPPAPAAPTAPVATPPADAPASLIPGHKGVPYLGKPHAIPGRIEAEDFDLGGEGVGYHDRTTKNQGLGYRPDGAPGIKGMTVPPGKKPWYKSNDGTPTIGWFFVGEWLHYTVDVKPGLYDIKLRIATPMHSKAFNIYLDKKLIAYIEVPNTGEYSEWVTVHQRAVKVTKEGLAVLKIQAGGMDLDECDLNWIEFVPANPMYINFL